MNTISDQSAVEYFEKAEEFFRARGRDDLAIAFVFLRTCISIGGSTSLLFDISDHAKRVVDLRMQELRREIDVERIELDARRAMLGELIALLKKAGIDVSQVPDWPDVIE